MTKSSERVKRWRRNTKKRIIESMGGSCVCCGYKKCYDALELHHIDSSQKEIGFGAIRANPKSWNIIVNELKNCVLLCCRCHREIHAGERELPESYAQFNDDFIFYREYVDDIDKNGCPVCGKDKLKRNITCSRQCAAKNRGKVNWDQIDVYKLLKELKSYEAVGDHLGVSGSAVRKRILKKYR